jgi:large subunit ribosomal protein L10
MIEEKQFLLDEVKEKIGKAKGFVMLSYQTLNASRARAFRSQMAHIGAEFAVGRKRLLVKAAEEQGISLRELPLSGHIGILLTYEDATAIVKAAAKFTEENDKSLTLLGGHIDGALCTAEDIDAIVKLPSLPEMRAQLLALLMAPMTQTAQTCQAILASILYCIEEKTKKG